MSAQDQPAKNAEARAVELFVDRLRSISQYKDAVQCAEERPPKGQPGRAIRSRFDAFLHSFTVPEGAGLDEAVEYARLFECFVQEGTVRRETVTPLRSRIERAITAIERRDDGV